MKTLLIAIMMLMITLPIKQPARNIHIVAGDPMFTKSDLSKKEYIIGTAVTAIIFYGFYKTVLED